MCMFVCASVCMYICGSGGRSMGVRLCAALRVHMRKGEHAHVRKGKHVQTSACVRAYGPSFCMQSARSRMRLTSTWPWRQWRSPASFLSAAADSCPKRPGPHRSPSSARPAYAERSAPKSTQKKKVTRAAPQGDTQPARGPRVWS